MMTALSIVASSALASEGKGSMMRGGKTEKAQADFGVGKFYLKGLVGWNFAGNEKVEAAKLNAGEVKMTKNNRFKIGGGLGYELIENLRLELTVDVSPSKTYNKIANGSTNTLESGSQVNTMLLANYDLGNISGMTPFVTAGFGWSHNKYTATTQKSGQSKMTAEVKGSFFTYAVGAGLGYELTRDVITELSYLYNGANGSKNGVKGKVEGHSVNMALRFKL